MKNGVKLLLIIIAIIILVVITFAIIHSIKVNNNTVATLKVVVVKVDENSLVVMETQNINNLISINAKSTTDIKFKKGQELLIYYDGIILTSYPAQINHIGKIKIAKEESDVVIPDSIIRYCYSSPNNVNFSISELTSRGISYIIKDTNELPYNYSSNYVLYNKVKDNDYTGIGYKIGEDTENSTSGYSGTGSEYIWEEAKRISNALSENTGEMLLERSNSGGKNERYTIARGKFDWTSIYGELKERRI